jgi:hypothetical protein
MFLLGRFPVDTIHVVRRLSTLASVNTLQTFLLGFQTALCFHDHNNKTLDSCHEVFVVVCSSDGCQCSFC